MLEHSFNAKRTVPVLWLLAVVGSCSLPVFAEQDLVVSEHAIVNTGHHIYMRACAVCHGTDAKGNGPYKPMLVAAPPDLTVIARTNNGKFPFDQMFEIISGNELMPAHGARDMPVWGQEFAREAEMLGTEQQSLARTRILELIAYLAHIQEP